MTTSLRRSPDSIRSSKPHPAWRRTRRRCWWIWSNCTAGQAGPLNLIGTNFRICTYNSTKSSILQGSQRYHRRTNARLNAVPDGHPTPS
jgi:hypothetical protein